MIDWTKYFDRIYCIHYVLFKQRKLLMLFLLNRVGILNSGIFEWQYTYNTPLDKTIENLLAERFKYDLQQNDNISLILGQFNIFKNAYYNGYLHILVLEDDVRFLKDLNKIELIIQHRPKDANLILYDKGVFNEKLLLDFKSINNYFSTFKECCLASCFLCNKKGVEKILLKYRYNLYPLDHYFYGIEWLFPNFHYYCSKTNLAIQANFNQSNNYLNINKNIIHGWYSRQNIDYNNYMMRKDGSPYNYGDFIEE